MVRKLLETIAEWFFPSYARCLGCGDERGCSQPFLCDECARMLRKVNVTAGRDEWRRRGIESIAFVYYYGRPISGIIRALKFRGARILAKSTATSIAADIAELLRERFNHGYDCIIPIPLHPARLSERGYNQSELLAREVSKLCGIEVRTDIIERKRNTKQQSKLSKKERGKNLLNAFTVKGDLSGKSILLLDDVITTGNTICACAEALTAAGAKDVRAVSLAGTHYCHSGIKHTYHQKKA